MLEVNRYQAMDWWIVAPAYRMYDGGIIPLGIGSRTVSDRPFRTEYGVLLTSHSHDTAAELHASTCTRTHVHSCTRSARLHDWNPNYDLYSYYMWTLLKLCASSAFTKYFSSRPEVSESSNKGMSRQLMLSCLEWQPKAIKALGALCTRNK